MKKSEVLTGWTFETKDGLFGRFIWGSDGCLYMPLIDPDGGFLNSSNYDDSFKCKSTEKDIVRIYNTSVLSIFKRSCNLKKIWEGNLDFFYKYYLMPFYEEEWEEVSKYEFAEVFDIDNYHGMGSDVEFNLQRHGVWCFPSVINKFYSGKIERMEK